MIRWAGGTTGSRGPYCFDCRKSFRPRIIAIGDATTFLTDAIRCRACEDLQSYVVEPVAQCDLDVTW